MIRVLGLSQYEMPRTVYSVGIDETTSDELLSVLDDDQEVNLEVGSADSTHSVTLRKQGDTYYCDTSVKLYSYESHEELLSCLEELGVPTPPNGS
jgi:hypothetical protein